LGTLSTLVRSNAVTYIIHTATSGKAAGNIQKYARFGHSDIPKHSPLYRQGNKPTVSNTWLSTAAEVRTCQYRYSYRYRYPRLN